MENIYIGYKEKNKFIKKKSNFGVTSINQLIHSNPLNEIHKEKDYYSDFDNFEMKKFDYNKLEIINKNFYLLIYVRYYIIFFTFINNYIKS